MRSDQSYRNHLLASLSSGDSGLIIPSLERLDLPVRYRLAAAHEPIGSIYFLEAGIASITSSVGREPAIEIGIIGREGVVNLPALIGSDRSPNNTYMQVGGSGLRIGTETLLDAMGKSVSLTTMLLRSVHVFMVQTASTVLANGRASLAERLARWLLMALDRVDGDEIALTHEFLSVMLGVRRPGVTLAVREFERRGLIAGSRGVITILDRDGLAISANGYYGVAEAELTRLSERQAIEKGERIV